MRQNKQITLLVIIFTMVTGQLLAQGFSGVATYKASSSISIEMDSTKVSSAQMKAIKEKLQQGMQEEYTLAFNASESVWKEIELLDGGPVSASSNGMEIIVAGSGGNELIYKNVPEKRFEEGTDLMGKRFIIKDSLPEYEWKLTNETKKVGAYNCQKAIYTRIVDAKKFSTGMEEMEVTKDTIETVAWFTMDIPVSNGPDKYYGLPGLIMEVQKGRRQIICTKLVLNPKDPIKIEKPTKGKVVSAEEYRVITEKKMEDMMKRYNGGGNGETIEISIGG